jgi:hypothetical protein
MVSNDKYTFIHLRKTGGTTIRKILVKYFNGFESSQKMTKEKNDFMLGIGLSYAPGLDTDEISEPLEAHKTINKKVEGNKLIISVREPLTWFMSKYYYNERLTNKESEPTPEKFKVWLKGNADAYIKEYQRVVKNLDVDYVIKMESMLEDILYIMGDIGFDISEELRTKILSEPVYNALSYNRDINEHYDNELKDLVYNKNKFFFDKFNYNK